MSTTTETQVQTTQVYRVYIKATPQAVWDAITRPEWTLRYGYTSAVEYDLRPGGAYLARPSDAMRAAGDAMGIPTPDVIVDGEVVEAVPPRRLVQTWRLLMDPEITAEGFTRLTYEIDPVRDSTRLTVTHELEGAPKLALMVSGAHEDEGGPGAGGGWAWILSELKTLLETGHSFQGEG
jgi:uncharacterized protein YndB with AHSA1/START domain